MAGFIRSQLFVTLPTPTNDCSGKTVIVTGSNVGLGLEAARHFARLGAEKIILAVRSIEKGETAKKDIESSTSCKADTVEVWQLDLASYDSVKEFASRASKNLRRVDILLENAGITSNQFKLFEDNESTLTTNVVSTFLLAYLMLPQLKDTAAKYNVRPTLTIVSSEVQFWASFKEQKAPEGKIFEYLNDKSKANMGDRYQTTKLLEAFVVREMANQRPADSYPVTLNYVNPGLCHSSFNREGNWILELLKFLLARSTEAGSRTLVHAATSGADTHGCYMSDCAVTKPAAVALGESGRELGKRIYDELVLGKLEKISPGVSKNL